VPILLQTAVHSAAWVGTVFPGFFLMDNAVVPSVSGYDWPPDRNTLFHAQVRAIDGEAVRSSADLYRRVATQPPGTEFRYEFLKHGETVERTIASRRFGVRDFLQTYAVLLVFGLISLTAGIVVGFLQPATRQARVYHMQAVVVGLYAITGAALYQGGWTGLTVLYLVLESWVGATFMHLALRFPIERALTGWRRAVLAALYGLALVQTVLALRGFYADPPELAAIQRNYLINAASFVFFLASLAYAYWEDRTPVARARVKALFPGLFFGTLLMFYAFVNNARAGGDFPMQFGILFVPVLYVSVAWAIARHDLFDIDRVVRQSFVYATLSAIVLGAYVSLLSIVAWLFPGVSEPDTSVLTVGFVLLTALLIDPLRRSVQYVIDRAFYRTRLDYSATISQLSDALTTLLDARAIVNQVVRVLLDAMHLERAALCFFETDGRGQLWIGEPEGPLSVRSADGDLQLLTAVAGRAARLWTIDALAEVSQPAAQVLRGIGAAACLPLIVSGRAGGVLLLGRRRSGKPFAADDAALLRTLAGQAAVALQNAVSFHALEELTRTLDERVRLQTEELRSSHAALERAYGELKNAQSQLVQSEKMASLGQLVAGVAHELNNPASFVHGAMENLREFFTEYLAALGRYRALVAEAGLDDRAAEQLRDIDLDFLERETPELLAACTEGSERIRRTVDDLRTFARVDRGGRVAVDVGAGIDSTLRLLHPRLTRTSVRTECDFGEVARVDASPGRLNQVWMNLLTNAIDALDGTPNALLRIAARNDGDQVVVEIQDNGRGMTPETRERIFEPFFTTKAIGEGTGLGLSIVYGIVRELGGAIEVVSAVGAGTTVRVRLPAMARPATETGAP
jgi:signal transduction histidine kinase